MSAIYSKKKVKLEDHNFVIVNGWKWKIAGWPDPPIIEVEPAYPRSQVLNDKTVNQQIEWTEESFRECNIFYEADGSKWSSDEQAGLSDHTLGRCLAVPTQGSPGPATHSGKNSLWVQLMGLE